MGKHSHTLPVIFILAALVGGSLAWGSSRATSAAAPANTWARFARRHHCFLVMEGAYVDKRLNYAGGPPALPQDIKTIPALVKWLRASLPQCTVWRDKADNHIIHVVYTKALKWKANPVNERLTFRGTMSLNQVVSRILHRRFPQVSVACLGDKRNGILPGSAVSRADERAYNTPHRFDVKGVTLRQFLTTGVPYNMASPHPPVVLWDASYFLRHGKFTGRVDIIISGVPRDPGSGPQGATEMVAPNDQANAGLIPVGGSRTAAEVAQVVRMFVNNGHMKGQTVNVDGGWYMIVETAPRWERTLLTSRSALIMEYQAELKNEQKIGWCYSF